MFVSVKSYNYKIENAMWCGIKTIKKYVKKSWDCLLILQMKETLAKKKKKKM